MVDQSISQNGSKWNQRKPAEYNKMVKAMTANDENRVNLVSCTHTI